MCVQYVGTVCKCEFVYDLDFKTELTVLLRIRMAPQHLSTEHSRPNYGVRNMHRKLTVRNWTGANFPRLDRTREKYTDPNCFLVISLAFSLILSHPLFVCVFVLFCNLPPWLGDVVVIENIAHFTYHIDIYPSIWELQSNVFFFNQCRNNTLIAPL